MTDELTVGRLLLMGMYLMVVLIPVCIVAEIVKRRDDSE